MESVDWSKVKTERGYEEEAIRYQADELRQKVDGIEEDVEGLVESPGELTPAAIAETLNELAESLARLTHLFLSHLQAADLDDQTKAVCVGGGEVDDVVEDDRPGTNYAWEEKTPEGWRIICRGPLNASSFYSSAGFALSANPTHELSRGQRLVACTTGAGGPKSYAWMDGKCRWHRI